MVPSLFCFVFLPPKQLARNVKEQAGRAELFILFLSFRGAEYPVELLVRRFLFPECFARRILSSVESIPNHTVCCSTVCKVLFTESLI